LQVERTFKERTTDTSVKYIRYAFAMQSEVRAKRDRTASYGTGTKKSTRSEHSCVRSRLL